MSPKSANSRCQALAKSGKRCRAAATAGGLCFFHANPNKAVELGRIGGRKNRHHASESTEPAPRLETAIAVRAMVDRLIADVYAGTVHPRIAAGLAPLLNLQLRAIELADLEQQAAKLEALAAEVEAGLHGGGGVPELDWGDLPRLISQNPGTRSEQQPGTQPAAPDYSRPATGKPSSDPAQPIARLATDDSS